jgi:glycosyltransferase involved in cell wall biosynthesis
MKEGWGITNIEANACGTPVISSNVPGLRDSVKNNQSGLLYEYGDIEQLAAQIISVLSDKSKLDRLSQGAVEWAARFSWDKSAEQMEEFCRQISHHGKFI